MGAVVPIAAWGAGGGWLKEQKGGAKLGLDWCAGPGKEGAELNAELGYEGAGLKDEGKVREGAGGLMEPAGEGVWLDLLPVVTRSSSDARLRPVRPIELSDLSMGCAAGTNPEGVQTIPAPDLLIGFAEGTNSGPTRGPNMLLCRLIGGMLPLFMGPFCIMRLNPNGSSSKPGAPRPNMGTEPACLVNDLG